MITPRHLHEAFVPVWRSVAAGTDGAVADEAPAGSPPHAAVAPGARLPEAVLTEACRDAAGGLQLCRQSPTHLAAGKTVLVVGLGGAHGSAPDPRLVAYARSLEGLQQQGIDEVWCVAIHNPYILGAWGLALATGRALRLLADRQGQWTRALGRAVAAPGCGLQPSARPYVLLAREGVVRAFSDAAIGLPAAVLRERLLLWAAENARAARLN